ncbi:MAG TPA: serine/threonine-protein kinase [Ktedonobacteraceae bacterium]|nr:serine/threonine-protein kinase [Ktedonobacteraceae bacterium]
MDVATHEILFSFDQPANVLPSLLARVQQALSQQKTRSGKSVLLHEGHRLLIIDGQRERATYLVQVLSLAGYRSIATPHSLEAFTLFLQGSFVPLLIILGDEDPAKRFFLQRLLQQMVQKFEQDVPVIRLITQLSFSETAPLFASSGSVAQNPVTPPSITDPMLLSLLSQQPAPRNSAPLPDGFSVPHLATQHSTSAPSGPSQPLSQASSVIQSSSTQKKQTKKISLEGQSLGRYQIETLLGSGPLGSVYRVYDRLREGHVALKAVQMDSSPYFVNDGALEEEHLFQREATLLARLKHPSIAQVMHTGKSYVSGSSFIYKTMPLYSEGSLAQWLYEHDGSNKVRAPYEVLPLITQLADALQYAHDQQILCQNFKLNNILVKEPAKSLMKLQLILADFMVGTDSAPLALAADSFTYIAPECWDGSAVPASDQYALAVLAYELLAGRPLFQGNTEVMMKRLHLTMQPPPPANFNSALSAQASAAIMRALAKKPEERFASVGVFAQTMQRFCS